MRLLNKLLLLFFIIFSVPRIYANENLKSSNEVGVSEKLQQLEIKHHVYIGLSAIYTKNNSRINFNANELFPLDSTSKLMTVSAILKKSEGDSAFLKKIIFFTLEDVRKSGYAPITKKHIKSGMTVANLCAAALEYSDNTASNLLMKILGGPNKITQFSRSIGDKKYFLVRWEPNLNSAIPDDKRDTTTPFSMANSVWKLVLGNALNNSKCKQLQIWLKQCKTGNHLIRAGAPSGSVVADKTGMGGYGSIGDVGVVWPPHSKPIVLAIYVRQNKKNAHTSGSVIASATRIVLTEFLNKHNWKDAMNQFSIIYEGRLN